jgi:2-polyprenyl-3-methyl-5-hydroxy-6-metoxy-1,4-benzoquinol methylase
MNSRAHRAYLPKRESYFHGARPEMLEFVPPAARRVVEFGCGAGAFSELIKRRGDAYVVGVEMMAGPAALASDRLDKVFQRDIEQGLEFLAGERFDCAVFLDVLEHLRSPWEVLTELQSYLVPGGTVVASIPNLRHYEVMKSLVLKKRFEYQDEGVMDRTHLRFFTRDDVLELFAATGFTVSRISGLKGRFPWKFRLLNRLAGGALSDMQFLQFAVAAVWAP